MANEIKIGNNSISSIKLGTADVSAVYLGTVKVYPVYSSGQTPCYAVVSNISQYSETEFVDVYNLADDKWYKLNNLNQYEKYGVYDTTNRYNATYYDGKLVINDGYEYLSSGSSWYNVGAVSGSSRLPQGYTELEYIQSNSTSSKTFIKLDYNANNNTRVVADMQRMLGASGNPRLFGCGWWNQLGYQINIENGKYYYKFGNNSGWYQTTASADYDRHIFDFNNNGQFYVDSTLVETLPTTSFTCTDSFGVMGYLRNGSSYDANEEFYGKMYSFKLYESGTLLYDLVPAKRDSDDVIGVYDLVNNTFYGPYVNGPFVAGPEEGGTTYPMYYDEKADPPDDVVFATMADAESYQCPWVGMTGIISNTDYIFDENYDWVTKYQWVTVSGEYLCVGNDKYTKEEKQQRNVDDTWSNTGVYQSGTLIEADSPDCQKFTGKWIGYYSDSTAYSAACNSTTSAITKYEVRSGNYTAYTKVIIGDCVSSIREAFQQCTSMTEVEIGSGVTTDLYYSFEDCSALTSVTWYATALDSQNGAFQRCYSLQKLVMYATTPPNIDYNFFNGVPGSLIIYVPDASVSAYQSLYRWRDYTIKGHSEL